MPTSTQDVTVALHNTIFDLNTALDRTDLPASVRATLEQDAAKVRDLLSQIQRTGDQTVASVAVSVMRDVQGRLAPYAVPTAAPRPSTTTPRPTTSSGIDPNAPITAVTATTAAAGLSKQATVGVVVGALGTFALVGALVYLFDRR